jgi:O-antigen/teichoic acid export membrane protein
MLMGLVVACRWPIGLYQGALIGAQCVTVSSGINMAMVSVGNLGAVMVLAFVSPTIEAFFIWQASVGLVYAITMRAAAWRIIGKTGRMSFDVDRLKSVWRFTAGMSGIALSATVLTQLDKVILSKTLGLEGFGHYMLAATVVGALYMLIMPVFNVIYPRLSALAAAEEVGKLTDLYRSGTRLFATVLFPVAMLLAVFAEDLVRVWTGNATVASSVAPVIALLSIGSALHGVMFIPYALQLAYGITRLPLTINMILMAILVPLIIFFALSYGVLGGAAAWLIFQVLYVFLGAWLTHRQLLKGVGILWLFNDVGIPFFLTSMAGVGAHYIVQQAEYSFSIKLMGGIILAYVAALLSFVALPKNFRIDILKNIDFIK